MANKKNTPAVDTKGKAQTAAEEEEDGDYSTGGHGPGGGKDYRKPKDTKGTLLRLLGYIVSNKLLLISVLVMMLISTGANLIATYFMKPLLDEYIIPNITAAEKDWSGLALQLLKLAGIYLCGVAANYGQSAIMVQLSQKAINKLRKDLFDKLQALPISYYDAHNHGEIMSRFTNDADTVQMAMEQTVTTFISCVLTFVGTIVMMIRLNYLLFLITLVALVLDVFLVKKVGGRSKQMFKLQQKSLGSVNAYIEEMVEGIKVVKAFNYEDRAEVEFSNRNQQYRNAAVEANFFGSIMGPLLNQSMGIFYAFTTIAAAIMVIKGSVLMGSVFTIGSMTTYLTYSKQVAMPINQISNQVVNLLSAIAGAERMFNVMDNVPEVDEGTVTLVPVEAKGDKLTETTKKHTGRWAWKNGDQLTELKGHVQIEDVHFHYVEGKPVLKGISVEALPGQKIAFVGSTGAGKTTITNLINRFYDVQEGRILYDGINVKDIAKDDLRRSLVVILQDTHLFTGTIMENIRYGRLDATDGECIEAAKTANAYNFITSLPDGFQTQITGDGSNLSQGQRQLLNIARAAVAEPPVLIMDEATSSIDTRTEKEIEKGMDGLMHGRTVFVIAHRLSTVRDSDKIAVIEAGQIIEFGSHQELLDLGGRYYELYTGQHRLE
jgi:ATP-binding cassette subfamily B protein